MKVVFCSDLHGKEKLYSKLLDFSIKNKISAVIIGGDICPHAHLELNQAVKFQRDFIKGFLIGFLGKLKENSINAFVMMGNDDFKANMDLLERIDKEGIASLIHNRSNKLGRFNIVGYSFVSQMPFLLKDWEKMDNRKSKPLTDPSRDVRTSKKEEGTIEDDMKKIIRLSNPKKTIYIMHAPPFGTVLDMIGSNAHVGSKSIRRFIEMEQPLLTLHGHIHESYEISGSWKDRIGSTLCINPGVDSTGEKLHLAVIDLDDLNNIALVEV